MSSHLKNFLKDRNEIIKYSKEKDNNCINHLKKIIDNIKSKKEGEEKPSNIVADFTEYNPLHNGHKYCLNEGKKYGIFISILPAPLERSGRGIPYLVDRYIRSEMAIKAGADVVVEGPPMGIMGSGQYMQCLIKMFYNIGAEIIPRGHIEENAMEKVINCINSGYHIKVKPYNVSCIETGELLCEKLEIDNYVIASMSNTIYKVNKNYNINFNPKFVFIKRIEGISGTKIRESILNGKFDEIRNMLPETTLNILKRYYDKGKLNSIILKRFEDRILETANEYDLKRYIPKHIAEYLEKNRPYTTVDEIKNAIPYGFSRHYKERIISKLEARIDNKIISEYIKNYPSKIKILAVNDDF
ncbi:nucleotidyltransferase family protein [Methanothermococcus okinawensis]|uniref:Citrate lyase ligase domain protein n=1 Tax=Methanothermococcus okinawensis (strain DSM 14208 / JCM 11175 / IH1) TaxID=647113 RepID=F8AJZ3_METOI|nr:nucleotidyltransferase family protein [Methanothermococcus okinawensis]AEH07349.1 Citrate lyase ligase domain protein [Methanothermococcus okinawensis IH1]